MRVVVVWLVVDSAIKEGRSVQLLEIFAMLNPGMSVLRFDICLDGHCQGTKYRTTFRLLGFQRTTRGLGWCFGIFGMCAPKVPSVVCLDISLRTLVTSWSASVSKMDNDLAGWRHFVFVDCSWRSEIITLHQCKW